jgi:hypothetical protein
MPAGGLQQAVSSGMVVSMEAGKMASIRQMTRKPYPAPETVI